MTYKVENNKLVGPNVTYVKTSKKGGKQTPKFLVIHYTAGTSYEGDVATLSTSDRPASCQLVLAADGRITQIGDLNDVLWHAGKSSWKGYNGLNSHSIGIEVVCPGPLEGSDPGKIKTWTGRSIEEGKPYPFVWAAHKNGGPKKYWAQFTEKQIEVLIEIGTAIMNAYNLKEAVGHDDIAPQRKIDPGPSCPVSVFQALNGNKVDTVEIERPELVAKGKLKVTGVAPEKLNFRDSPNGDKKGELVEGQIVEKVGQDGVWVQVRTPGGFVGWVFGEFVKPV